MAILANGLEHVVLQEAPEAERVAEVRHDLADLDRPHDARERLAQVRLVVLAVE